MKIKFLIDKPTKCKVVDSEGKEFEVWMNPKDWTYYETEISEPENRK